MHTDHVVLWVADPPASVAFFTEVLGLEGVRVEARGTPPHRPLEAFYFTDPDGNVLEARYYE